MKKKQNEDQIDPREKRERAEPGARSFPKGRASENEQGGVDRGRVGARGKGGVEGHNCNSSTHGGDALRGRPKNWV